MKLFEEREGGQVVVSALTWVGPIRPVKVTRDKEEKTVYNFMLKSGFQAFQSVDYSTIEEAEEDRGWILNTLGGV